MHPQHLIMHVRRYKPTRTKDSGPLPCRVVACQAMGDQRVGAGQIAHWREYSGVDGYYELQFSTAVPRSSTPHDYVKDDPAQLQGLLSRELLAALRRRADPPPPATMAVAAAPAAAPAAELERGKAPAVTRPAVSWSTGWWYSESEPLTATERASLARRRGKDPRLEDA